MVATVGVTEVAIWLDVADKEDVVDKEESGAQVAIRPTVAMVAEIFSSDTCQWARDSPT